MKKLTIPWLIVFIFVLFNGNISPSFADDKNLLSKNGQNEIDKLRDGINSNIREVRFDAAKKIISLYYDKKIKIKDAVPGLIKELESINWDSLTEGDGEYSGELIYILGEYGDRRAIPSIVNSLGHAGGTLVLEALAKIGPDTIDSLTDKLDDRRENVRRDALFYLGKIPKYFKKYGHGFSNDSKSKVKKSLKKGLNDSDESVRLQAIDAIRDAEVNFDKEELSEVEALLESIAKRDPYSAKRKINEKERQIYPVRDKATKVLAILKKK